MCDERPKRRYILAKNDSWKNKFILPTIIPKEVIEKILN